MMVRFMKKVKSTAAILALLSISQIANSATITNGNFDAGLDGWIIDGNVTVSAGGYAVLNTFPGVDTSEYGGTTGSILSQVINALAGDIISFRYNFETIDELYDPDGPGGVDPYNDFSIVAGDKIYLIHDVAAIGNAGSSGWQDFTFTALNDFSVLKFVVSNHGDTFNDSLIFIDDVTSVSNPVSAVPVPAAVWLFGSGLAGLLGYRKRGQSSTA